MDNLPAHETDARTVNIPGDPLPSSSDLAAPEAVAATMTKPEVPRPPSKLELSLEQLRDYIPDLMGNLRGYRYPKPISKIHMMCVTNTLVNFPDFFDQMRNPPEVSATALYRIFAKRFDLPDLTPEQELSMIEKEQKSFEDEAYGSGRAGLIRYIGWRYSRWSQRQREARSGVK